MGAQLQYAKVIDRELFYKQGAKIHPGLENEVIVEDERGVAAAFLVMRAWGRDRGTFTEEWRIEAPGGLVVYKGTPRELHIATTTHVERLEDEVSDLELDAFGGTYTVVFNLDDREVARVRFSVRSNSGS